MTELDVPLASDPQRSGVDPLAPPPSSGDQVTSISSQPVLLPQLQHRIERLLAITAAIADAVSSEQVFEAVVDHVAEAVDASTAALWLVDEEGRCLTLARARGYADAARRHFEAVSLDAAPSFPALDAVRRREAIWIPNQAALFQQYPHLSGIASAGRSYRIACLPLSARGRTLGALGLTIEEAREAGEDEQEFLRLAARYASQAIERLRLLEAERFSRARADLAAQRLGMLSRASRIFADVEIDLAARLQAVAAELASTLDSAATLALLENDGLLHVVGVHHPVAEAAELLRSLAASEPLRPGEGIAGSIASSGQSVILPRIDPDAEAADPIVPAAYRTFLRRFPAYAVIGAALRVRGRVIGSVTALRVRRGESYSLEDLRLLEELAERAAVAVENSRLYEETALARSRAEQLYRFAQAVMAADQLDRVFDAALASIEAALEAKRAAILSFDARGVMRFKAWHGISDEYRAAVEGHSPWPRNAEAPQPVIVADAQADASLAAYRGLFEREGIGALAFIPLVSAGRLLGKFMVYYDHPHQFARHELETAAAIGNHLASVMTRFAAIAQLRETIRQNELFAGVLAHDLRNPLGAIITAAQLLLMSRPGTSSSAERSVRPVHRILSSGQRMTAMIDQLLDFTRARSGGGIRVEPRSSNLADLLQQALGELLLAHPEWKVQHRLRGDPGGTWDPDRLLQVISNLVANAGQHGMPGAPVEVLLDGTEAERVRIEVHNQGSIAEPLLPFLFDPFRIAQHRRGPSSGLGLGLFIVREIVQAHGGAVRVESSAALGTTFQLELPRHATSSPHPDGESSARSPGDGGEVEASSRHFLGSADESAPASEAEPAEDEPAPQKQRRTLLVVDDDVDLREALAELLEQRGFAVHTAANGIEALRLLRSMSSLPSAVLLDLMMPVMDGYGFLDERRKDALLASVPVIVITAGHGVDQGRLGDGVPMFPKPLDFPGLMDLLHRLPSEGGPS